MLLALHALRRLLDCEPGAWHGACARSQARLPETGECRCGSRCDGSRYSRCSRHSCFNRYNRFSRYSRYSRCSEYGRCSEYTRRSRCSGRPSDEAAAGLVGDRESEREKPIQAWVCNDRLGFQRSAGVATIGWVCSDRGECVSGSAATVGGADQDVSPIGEARASAVVLLAHRTD